MAGRIRSIKPEILSDAKAGRLSDRAWRLWVSMWTLADDHGLLPADPEWLGHQAFWGNPQHSASNALAELIKSGLICTYTHNGDQYAKIMGWSKHQKIDRPSLPKFPVPSESLGKAREGSRGSSSDSGGLDADGMGWDGMGVDGKGGEYIEQQAARCVFDFKAIRAKYPRLLGTKIAEKRFHAQITTQEKYDALHKAIDNYLEVLRIEQVIPKHFSTFMNCWEEYIDYVPTTHKPLNDKNKFLQPRDPVLVTREEIL